MLQVIDIIIALCDIHSTYCMIIIDNVSTAVAVKFSILILL